MGEDSDSESLYARLEMRRAEHQALDEHIVHLVKKHVIDYEAIKRLKIRKLQLKDEIAILEHALTPEDDPPDIA